MYVNYILICEYFADAIVCTMSHNQSACIFWHPAPVKTPIGTMGTIICSLVVGKAANYDIIYEFIAIKLQDMLHIMNNIHLIVITI